MEIKTDNMNKKCIALCVDFQNDFISGSLPVEGGEKAMINVANYLAEKPHDAVLLTVDFHPITHYSFKSNGSDVGIWPNHCVQYSEGAAIPDYLLNKAFSKEFSKHTQILCKGTNPMIEEYSILDNPYSKLYLEGLFSIIGKDNLEIEIMGLAGDICVLETIKGLCSLGLKDNLVVMTDCIASIDGGRTLDDFCQENGIATKKSLA